MHVEGVLEVLRRLLEIHAIGGELGRRDAAPDADIEPAAAQMIEHAQLFVEPQRMVERQQEQQGTEPDARGLARRRREIDVGDGVIDSGVA